jgi:hypothetical protein
VSITILRLDDKRGVRRRPVLLAPDIAGTATGVAGIFLWNPFLLLLVDDGGFEDEELEDEEELEEEEDDDDEDVDDDDDDDDDDESSPESPGTSLLELRVSSLCCSFPCEPETPLLPFGLVGTDSVLSIAPSLASASEDTDTGASELVETSLGA